jgi:hypothetical protein
MKRVSPSIKLARQLAMAARRLRRFRVGDPRILAGLLERAADVLMQRTA